MSLYFNWSCDFQRFTKSKKLSKFQVRTTTLFISNKSLSTSLFNLQGTIRCFKEFSQLFVVLNRSSTAYLVYQNQKRLSRTFFKFFFEESSRSKSNFSVLRLSLRDSFNRIPNPRAFVKHFFRFLRKLLLQTKTAAHAVVFSFSRCSDKIKPLSAKTVPSHMIGVMVSCRINAELTIVITGVA